MVPMIMALVLASCATPRPSYDWCFHYDFTQSNYGFNLITGEWKSGRGFLPHFYSLGNLFGGGDFLINGGTTPTATPKAVVFYLARGDSIAAPIDVEVEAYAFGMVSGNLHSIVPQNVNSATIVFINLNGASGSGIRVEGNASRPVEWHGLDVMGDGANPFPQNNCTDYSTPYAGPTIMPPDADISDGLVQGDALLNSVNRPLSPGLVPNENGAFVFGAIKWLTAPATADEIAGPFAPAYSHIGILLWMMVAMVTVYLIVYVAIYIVRWVVWIIKMILLLIQAVVQAAGGLVGFIFRFLA